MVKGGIQVNIDTVALSQIKQICNYIKRDSPKNSVKVKKEIFSTCKALSQQPEKYPADKYKSDNDGSYRAFELYHYRIAYRVLPTEIRVLTIRHTSMEPLEY